MKFKAEIDVMPLKSLLDPQGKAVTGSMKYLGLPEIENVRIGKHITLEIGPSSEFQGLVVPSGCAHGYMTLEANSTLIYFMDNIYSAENSCGILWNDQNLKIKWVDESPSNNFEVVYLNLCHL